MRRLERISVWGCFAAALCAALPAGAEEPPRGPALWERLPAVPPADNGKAMLGTPSPVPLAERDLGACDGPVPCGARLLGTVRRNGAVELQVPALKW